MYRARCWHGEVGFDGVDIKSCHRYLLSELLASHTRGGKYGGSFENRTRFLRQTIRAVREAVGDDFIVACRFNVFDAHPYPYGFGCDREDMWKFDPTGAGGVGEDDGGKRCGPSVQQRRKPLLYLPAGDAAV